MLWNFKTLGLLLAVTQGPFILCLGFGTSVPTPCGKCPVDSQRKVTAKIRQVAKEAKELFDSYLTHQGFSHGLDQSCYKPVNWFSTGRIPEQPAVIRLQKLNRTIQRMVDALYNIGNQQQTLNNPDAPLLSELKKAQGSAKGLLNNIRCALCLLGVVISPTTRPTLKTPTTITAFQQKIDGCKVLWNYSRFLEALVQGSERKVQQAGNNRRRRRKSPKRRASLTSLN